MKNATKKTATKKVAKKTVSQSMESLVEKLTNTFKNSLMSFVENINTNGGTASKKSFKALKSDLDNTIKKSAKVEKNKGETAYEMFMEALRQIGRPVTTSELAKRYRLIHKDAKLPKDKTVFMQQLYNSASYLAKEGKIQRHAVGKRLYEYSLKEPKNNTAKAA